MFIFINIIPRLKKIPRTPRSRLLYDHVRRHFMEISNSASIPHQYIPVDPDIPPGRIESLHSSASVRTVHGMNFTRRKVREKYRNLRKRHCFSFPTKISISYSYLVVEEFEGDLALYGVDPEEIKKYEENFEGAVSEAVFVVEFLSSTRKTIQKLLKAEAKSSFDYSKEISSEHDSGTEPVTPSDKQSITPEGNIIDFLCRMILITNLKFQLSENPFLRLFFVKNAKDISLLIH